MPRPRLLAAAVAAVLLLGACSAGAGAVDQSAGADLRFVTGNGQGTVLDTADRPDAPDIDGRLLTGEKFDLHSWRGQVVVMNFWGSWCAPCRAEADQLMAVYTATKDTRVRFLGINVKDDRQLAIAFEKRFRVTYPSIFDPKGRVAVRFRNYPPNAIPSTIIIDRDGRIAAAFLRPLLTTDLMPVVRTLAAESALAS